MILSQINSYLAEHGQVNTSDIALHFGVAPDALKGMLELLEAKGRVRAIPADTPACGSGCRGCAVANCGPQMWETLARK
ncbi:FeoC-like transcriptional regulator [Cohaesibacter celericrescens]|uniref:FeoC-like transcriptional regulator n=1 Tax=Cohaesibacter celericrescens TaxID=2067669 RepID=UPI003568E7FC